MKNSGLHLTWNIPYLLLAAAVAFAGAHVTVSLADQYRISCAIKPKLMGKKLLLFMMAFSYGGVGTWTVHFVGMGALVLKDSDGESIHRKFDRVYIAVSLLSAVCVTYIALLIAARDTLHTKSRDDIYKMVLDDSVPGSANAVRSRSMLIRNALTTRLRYLVFGGIVGSAGVCATHYIGNLALLTPVDIEMDLGLSVASTIVAIVGSVVSFWVLFRVLALYPEYEKFRLMYIVVVTATICGMHFTGVAATTFHLRDDGEYERPPVGKVIEPDVAVQNILASGLIFCFISNALILAEKRLWIRDFMTANRRVTKMMERLSQDLNYQNESFVTEYFTSTAHIREAVSSSVKYDPNVLFRSISSRSLIGTAKISPGTSCDESNDIVLNELEKSRDVVELFEYSDV